ncbi:hypothetical protein RHSIM_Rhsim05G0058000 [Rhododendron simsii]|uniref:LysM domain-containing protein n=1 Tax=Rhododendron simsii TaxID=118357 RepID=A0A834GWI0_RHOSS|nr:hypothetical protein RHSIM_Rhsim05G0058000 [Rhododendron simsii]
MFRSKPVLPFSLLIIFLTTVEPKCPETCDLALASYNVWYGATLTFISEVFDETINEILRYNPKITNQNQILAGSRIKVPFTCDCIDGEFLGHVFLYAVQSGNHTYDVIAEKDYANLTTAAWLERFNVYGTGQIPANVVVNVTVNCSCGDAAVSTVYGLFVTYPLGVGDSLESIAAAENISEAILQMYNPGVDFSAGSGLVYFPGRDESGNYPPLKSGTGRIGVFHDFNGGGCTIPEVVHPDVESQLPNQSQGGSDDDDKDANTGGCVSTGNVTIDGGIHIRSSNIDAPVSIGNDTINIFIMAINFVYHMLAKTRGGASIWNTAVGRGGPIVNMNTRGGGSIGNTNIEGG